jgi:hypothetical protein
MKKAASKVRLTPNQSSLVRLGRALFDAHIQLAEKRGYIQRVQEVEAKGSVPQEPEPLTDGIERLKRVVAYSPEKEASQILDAISPDLLDKILGKPDVMGGE